MEREAYHSMRRMQREHWWFLGRRRVVDALLESLHLPRPARILEAGAGSGGNIALLRRHGEVDAFDMDAEAAGFCREDTGVDCVQGSLPADNPYAGQARYDLVLALDVLEHIEDDLASLKSLAGCLAPGGRLLLTVPAYPWLFSGHDLWHHHRRRYTRTSLRAVAAAAGLHVQRCGYFNSLLLPVVVAVRCGQRLLGKDPRNDMRMPGRATNQLLALLFGAEAGVLRHVGFPAGVSLYLVADAGE